MKTVEKKVWPTYFSEILNGNKKFELRKNDFDIQRGDILFLREYDPRLEVYTGREIKTKVTFVLNAGKGNLPFFNPWDNLDQFQIIGFDDIKYEMKK